ncbi:xylosidase [Enterococcus sp. JM4C]|uniref:family 43 glycosylhydrolase n=1 Tax=Candidatus Enterococcus huntleyi TaxID=1857217 RepID=UPI00137B4286|nr:family 43 glycosylhydrolase [Enterococcus sp. JM4C]KAF1297543.1 xylosidase [Enterococcus sp. JM4C]
MKYKNQRNPILPLDIHIPDGEAHVMPDGKLYIYGSYDNQEEIYCSEEYHVVSTNDLETWEIHDTALHGKDIYWFDNPKYPRYPGIDWSKPTPFIKKMLSSHEHASDKEKFEKAEDGDRAPLLFAPDAIYKDGIYYLYFCMPDDSEGVATSKSPVGPFINPVQLPCGGIDPAVFIDDDGSAYYYWGQLYSHGVKLNDDMISFDGEIKENLVTEEEHYFHEGSSMRKIGNLYYLVYSNIERGKPTSLGYATSLSPLGPFTYQGVIINNEYCDPASWNNHGSIEKFNGQWYIFYHRCSRGVQQFRRLCIEPIAINEDGTIDEVKMTSQGVGAPFKIGEPLMGYQACELHGTAYIDVDSKYGEKLTNISAEDEIFFRYIQSEEGFQGIEMSASGSGVINLLFENQKVGHIRVASGSVIESNLSCTAGTYELKLKIEESDKLEIFELKFS